MADLVGSLNPMQRAAVELPAQNALILAGAGSGKTRVLTTRIAWVISHAMAYPSQILAVTFTNKAAREMKTRLEAILTADIRNMWVGTFHGISHRLLRAHALEANLPQTFQIIDQSDQLSLIKSIMREAGLDLEDEKNSPKKMQGVINNLKENGIRASVVSKAEATPTVSGVYRMYEERCQRDGLLDFAELLLRSVELLENNAMIREHYAARFRFILVDEFQDTNALQYRWLKALCSPAGTGQSLFCVGDDDQSIYAFRGARVGNMTDFIEDYCVQNIVKLEQNYRSTSHILDASNAVIANNENRMGKTLWTDSGAGDPITIYEAKDDRDEARTVTQQILTQHRSGLDWKDFAVLYRNNAQSRVIEQYFTANSVPYRIYGGLRFFDRQEVKDLMAYLRVLCAPDDVSVMRIINQPPRGIGKTSLMRVSEAAAQRGISIWEAINNWTDNAVSVSRIKPFVELIEALRSECAGLSLPEVIALVAEKSGLQAFYAAQKDQDVRLQNLSEVQNAAEGYCNENGIDENAPALELLEGGEVSPLEGFLSQATLEADDKNEGEIQNAVQMMTVHASKGLEFPYVYLCGLEDGLFPHAARPDENAEKALSEERRLMYVAMTRAKKCLHISWCGERRLYGDTKFSQASQFLDEIPSEHCVTQRSPFLEGEGCFNKRGTQSYYGAGPASRSAGSWEAPSRSQGWRGGAVGRASDFLSDKRREGGFSSGFKKSQKQSTSAYGLSEGDRVMHPKFGEGTVMKLANAESLERATAQVKFSTGVKELMLSFAKLQKC